MRPTVQMIFTVQEVRQNDSGLTYVRGYVLNGRDVNNNPSFATVNVFIPESSTYYADLALTLETGQRVFVAGTVSIGAFVNPNTQELRTVYKISFPSAFVPLDVPASDPKQEQEAEHEQSEVVQPSGELDVEPPSPRRVEMSGVAQASAASKQVQQSASTATRRPATFTIPRPQRVGDVDRRNGEEAEYDPFAE